MRAHAGESGYRVKTPARTRDLIGILRATRAGRQRKHNEYEKGEATADLEYSLETVACIGACGLSPCIMTNKKVQAKMTPKKVAEVFGKGVQE